MTHPEMKDLYELYALGVLEAPEAAEIEEHLRTECAYCSEQVAEARHVVAAMSGLAELKDPPASLRRRVIGSVKPEPPKRSWLFAVAGLSAACAALLAVVLWTGSAMRTYREQISELQVERRQLREALEILSRTDTKTVQFGSAEQPHGRVFVNRNNGLVFVGSRLPQLASNRTFQLWLIPAAGAPESAGLFRPNAAGDFVNVRTTPVDTSRIQAVAVSVEPPGGSPAPTTKPILIVPLG
jgi:anti-sigma-K factor RskA